MPWPDVSSLQISPTEWGIMISTPGESDLDVAMATTAEREHLSTKTQNYQDAKPARQNPAE